MKELKASTKAGQNIIARARHKEGYLLQHVYTKYSYAKENAYNWCILEYCKTDNNTAFAINSHNTFGFTCSWLGTKDGESILRYETKNNSYLVWMNR